MTLVRREFHGKNGGRISVEGNGVLFGKTIAKTAMPGTISRMTKRGHGRAYRWGEDGLAGISDDHQILCFALALWNGQDPILKERLFGLTNSEGNHGEDVKEYYFYLDNTPTHSYMKYLYKYPQSAYPYVDLIENNRRRRRHDLEYELLDTGVFDSDRYFDVFVEYAKGGPEDLLIRISAVRLGWCITVNKCCASRWNWQTTTVNMRSSRRSFSSIRSGSPRPWIALASKEMLYSPGVQESYLPTFRSETARAA